MTTSAVQRVRWDDEQVEQVNALIGRQMVHTETMTIARILLAQGAVVPRHEHVHEQITTLLEGRLRFVLGHEERFVLPGETLTIPSHLPHEVEALEASVVLDVFCPVRDDWVRGDDAYLRG